MADFKRFVRSKNKDCLYEKNQAIVNSKASQTVLIRQIVRQALDSFEINNFGKVLLDHNQFDSND